MFVCDRMTRNPISIKPEDKVDTAAALFKEHKIRRLPVVDHGKLGIESVRYDRAFFPGFAVTEHRNTSYLAACTGSCRDCDKPNLFVCWHRYARTMIQTDIIDHN